MDGLTWHLQNQSILKEIYNENKYKVRLMKNRIEKMRARNRLLHQAKTS